MKASFKVQRLLEEKERPTKNVESAASLQCSVLNNPRNFLVSLLCRTRSHRMIGLMSMKLFQGAHHRGKKSKNCFGGPLGSFKSVWPPQLGPGPTFPAHPPLFASLRYNRICSNFHIKSTCYTILNNYQKFVF